MNQELLDLFLRAMDFVSTNFPSDIEWSRNAITLSPETVTKQHFFREYIWAVFVAGFKYEIVHKKSGELMKAFFDADPCMTARYPDVAKEQAMMVIANKRKIDAVLATARKLNYMTFTEFFELMKRVSKNIDELKTFAYIGDVLKHQLARNIGIDTIKPDLHLVRLAKYFNMDVFSMCKELSEATGCSLHTVDSVLWRYSEQGKFKSLLKGGDGS